MLSNTQATETGSTHSALATYLAGTFRFDDLFEHEGMHIRSLSLDTPIL